MESQNSGQEHEIIELQEDNVEENEADHDKPLNVQTRKETDHWKSCGNVIFWRCKLWMVITTIFLVFFLVILISLILYSNVYTDEDDYWDPDALLNSGNRHNFSGTLELKCGLPQLFSEDITKRLTDVYSSSPALGRYFRSAQVHYFSNESSTVFYKLEFSVPPSAEGFMENTMNPNFIRNVLRQNIYDEDDTFSPGTSECNGLKLDPASVTITCSVQVMPSKIQSIQAGGNVTFSCQLAMKDVLQVTWQKEVDGSEDNIATYSAMNGQKIAKGYAGHVSFAHSELQTSGISLREVTLEDEGCYKCIFNTFPSGAVTGRMCLKVYAISDPKVEAKLIPNPDKTENSEQVVGLSCSATGKPAPKIIWRLPTILQQKPREYHIRLGNQTVTVISNFTHTHSKILQEHPIACVILHPSLNVTLVLPRDSLAQGAASSVAPSVAIAVGVLVPLTSLLLLACLLHCCLRHLCDPERNPTWQCWVGLPFPRVLQGSLPPIMGLSDGTQLCPATPGLTACCTRGEEG
ncbi:TPA-induced transmembrane protein isoform X2 [Heliangelus exortis]|uniref:TPA-induced transmembrane protein isoform X2 n=1 Tax=Heliangelus exortis TaxID=472823 RepID=UPI003A9005F8